MRTQSEILADARRVTRETIEAAASIYPGRGLDADLPVTFDLRGRSAGKFVRRDGKCWIRINAAMLFANVYEFLGQVIPHEVAHYVTYQLYGRSIRPHGREWQSVMLALGKTPDRCHTMETVPARRSTQFVYACGCSDDVRIGAVRHGRAQAKDARYSCRRCRQPIEFTGRVIRA